jgi:hypothetical protein
VVNKNNYNTVKIMYKSTLQDVLLLLLSELARVNANIFFFH